MSCRTIRIDDPDLGEITAHVRLGGPMDAETEAALDDVIREAARQIRTIKSEGKSASGAAASKQLKAEEDPPCRVCGCTEWTPCYDEEYDRCYQVEPDLCSACASGAAASERPSERQKPARNPGFSRNTRHETRITAF